MTKQEILELATRIHVISGGAVNLKYVGLRHTQSPWLLTLNGANRIDGVPMVGTEINTTQAIAFVKRWRLS